MLTNQKCGRHEHRHLLAILNCFESGANRNLGFAVTNVAGEKAIHWYFRFHVALNFFDGGELIGRLNKRESLFEFALPRSVWAEGVTARLHSHRIQLDQVDGNLSNCLARVALDARPFAATHLAEHRCLAADILGQIVELVDGNKQGVARVTLLARRIFDQQVFTLVLAVAAGAGYQLVKTTNAVNLVHHVVARLEGHRVDHLPALGGQLAGLRGDIRGIAAEEVALGQHNQFALWSGKAAAKAALDHFGLNPGGHHLLTYALDRAVSLGKHEDALPGFSHVLQPLGWCDIEPSEVGNLEHAEIHKRLVVCAELAYGCELFLADRAGELCHV